MTAAQMTRTSISIKKSAPSQPLNEVRTPQTKRSRYPEAERTGLSSVIENKFLDIVILVDGSDSFNQLNGGKITIAIGKSWWPKVDDDLLMSVTEFQCSWTLLKVGARRSCKRVVDVGDQSGQNRHQHLPVVTKKIVSNIYSIFSFKSTIQMIDSRQLIIVWSGTGLSGLWICLNP